MDAPTERTNERTNQPTNQPTGYHISVLFTGIRPRLNGLTEDETEPFQI